MQYMVMLTRADWEDSLPEDDRNRRYGEIMQWWGTQVAKGTIGEGYQLQPPDSATTVVLTEGDAQIIDGPFIEAKEAIGGYGIFDVADLDEAIAVVRTFPSPGTRAEIRPLVARS